MQLKDFIKSTKTGMNVEFSTAQGKDGKVLMVTSGEDKYILGASIENFQRFSKWIGKKAEADIKKLGKFYKTEYGFLPTIEIRTNVKVDKEENLNKNKNYNNDYDYDYDYDDDIVY